MLVDAGAASSGAVVDAAIDKAAALGPTDPAISQACRSLWDGYAKDGPAAIVEAVKAVGQLAATSGCAASPVAPIAPLCGVIGGMVAEALANAFTSEDEVTPADTREGRFWALYNQLAARCPDDRASGGEIWLKCQAQLQVLINLYIDGVCMGPQGGASIEMRAYNDGAPWSDGATYLAWLKSAIPAAWEMTEQVAEPSEFSGTKAIEGQGITWDRAGLWCFGWARDGVGSPVPPANGVPSYDAAATARFSTAVSRVLLAANVARERVFLGLVSSAANQIVAEYRPQCFGSFACQSLVEGDAWLMAYDVLMAARGIGDVAGTPRKVEASYRQKMEGYAAIGQSGVDKDVSRQHQLDERRQERRDAASSAAAPDAPASSGAGATVAKVLGVSLVAGAAALAVYRKRQGLPIVPRSWRPKTWTR